MSNTLYARKRKRCCRVDKTSGVRDCAAAKLGLPACGGKHCAGKERALVPESILRQREYLTRHLRPKSSAKKATIYKPSRPRPCRWDTAGTGRKCSAAIPCREGHCIRDFRNALSEPRLHEYALFHGPRGAGNFWELAALSSIGERPHPATLDERDDKVRAMRANLRGDSTDNERAKP